MTKLLIYMPALNEEKTIYKVIKSIPVILSQPFSPSGPTKLELILYPRKAVYNTMRQKTILTCRIKLYKICDGILGR